MNIKKLPINEYEKVRHLFHESDTNLAAAYGVIEGLTPGQIWVDNTSNPTVCLIICNDPYCLIAGNLSEHIFEDFFILLKQKQNVKLICDPRNNIDKLNFQDFGFTVIPRREYRYKNISLGIPIYENKTGYTLKQIKDERTFNLCIWKQLMLDIYGDVKTYIKNGAGFVLLDDEKQIVVSEAHGICSKQFIEIGTITHENYRGKNLSTIVCNHLIYYAIAQGLNPVWSCNEDNVASWKVAAHQGMDVIKEYNFYLLM